MSRSHPMRAALVGVAALMLLVGCSSASKPVISPKAAVAGATSKSIVIGGIAALSWREEEADAAAGAHAYFQFVNARGGVFGRRIAYHILDDHGDPALAPSLAYRLVQQDAVFAVFNVAGAAANMAVAKYLNSAGIPDVFADSDCECLNSPELPYTFFWQLSDVQEGKLLGSYIATHFTGRKIGVIYENDQFGRDELIGLRADRVRVAATVGCAPGGQGIAAQVRDLKSKGAHVVVAFTSAVATSALTSVMAGLKFHPQLVVTADGEARASGVITDSFLPSSADPASTPAGSWIALFRRIHDQFMPQTPFNAAVVYGMSAAYEFTTALFRSGPDPTRGGLISALTGLPQGPAVAPLAFGTSDHVGVTGGYVGVMRGGVLSPLTGVLTVGDSSAATVPPSATVQSAAPASGLPQG